MSGALVFWLIIYLASHYRSKGSGHQGSTQRSINLRGVAYLGVWLLALVVNPALAQAPVAIRLVAYPAVIVVLFPSLWARLTIRLGWVKASYWLGRLALFVHRRSGLAGGLLYGWRALQHLPAEADRYGHGKKWLLHRLDRGTKPLSSGVMAMSVLMQRRELGNDRSYARLRLLSHMDFTSMPSDVARYAFSWLAAHALARGNWDELVEACQRWRRHADIPQAHLLFSCYVRMSGGKVSRLTHFMRRLNCGFPAWTQQLPPYQAANADADDGPGTPALAQLIQQAWATTSSPKSETLRAQWHAALNTPACQDYWAGRAASLGCRNVSSALDGIAVSVATHLGSTPSESAGQPGNTALDGDMERLKYLADAIERRQQGRQLLSGALELEECFNFFELFLRLSGDETTKYHAYRHFEYAIWNWMADLWNIKKEKSLAYLVCNMLHDYAVAVDSDAARVYGQIIRREIR